MKSKSLNIFQDLLISFFKIGYIPFAPGTFATILAFFPFFWLQPTLRLYILLPIIVISIIFSLSPIRKIESEFGADPKFIVIDEAIGIWIVLLNPYIVYDWIFTVLALVLFRFFDIFKPFPINLLDKRKGAFFVIADDVLAGIFTIVFIHIFNFFANFFSFAYLLNNFK